MHAISHNHPSEAKINFEHLFTRSALHYFAILAGWLLHLTLDMFLNVHLFGPTMCAGLVLFAPARDIQLLLHR
jgi:hypothetical protein